MAIRVLKVIKSDQNPIHTKIVGRQQQDLNYILSIIANYLSSNHSTLYQQYLETTTMKDTAEKPRTRRKRRIQTSFLCHCCGKEFRFCWRCRCGFHICQECMDENVWGMSCNAITWQCPDCGDQNGFGNQ